MAKADWIEVGLKLVGAYFAVLAFTTSALTVIGYALLRLNLQTAWSGNTIVDPDLSPTNLFELLLHLLQPAAFVIAAFVLIRRTDWCLQKMGICQSSSSSHIRHIDRDGDASEAESPG